MQNDLMRIVIYVLFAVLNGAIEILTLLMFIRAVLSWFPIVDRSSKFMGFLYMITEPVISPVRSLLSRFDFVRRFPIDLSFLATYLLLHIIQGILVSVYNLIL
ncbi:MAG: YggT family protein [Clostridia bacterium]|nr:YggT family protein [Clostridia bacterium]